MLKPTGASEILSGFPPDFYVALFGQGHPASFALKSALHSETLGLFNCGDSTLVTRSDSSRFGITWVQSPMATTSTWLTHPLSPQSSHGFGISSSHFFQTWPQVGGLYLRQLSSIEAAKTALGPVLTISSGDAVSKIGEQFHDVSCLMDLSGHFSGFAMGKTTGKKAGFCASFLGWSVLIEFNLIQL